MANWTTDRVGLVLAAVPIIAGTLWFLIKATASVVAFFVDLRSSMRMLSTSVARLTTDVGKLTDDVGELVATQREEKARTEERFHAIDERLSRLEDAT
jgi:hypothetical protein